MQDPEFAHLEERDSHLPTPTPPPSAWNDGDGSGASDPGMIPLSLSKLKALAPFHFTWLKHPARWFKIVQQKELDEARVEDVAENLWFGDSNPAFLMSLTPVVVAAYACDLDAVALLSFDSGDINGLGLKAGDRLLSVNVYYRFNSGDVARDLTPGPRHTGNWQNFRPLIADLLTEYHGRVARRKAEISEELWERALEQAKAAMAQPDRPERSGNPVVSGWPA